jgi:nucleoside phosphorylase
MDANTHKRRRNQNTIPSSDEDRTPNPTSKNRHYGQAQDENCLSHEDYSVAIICALELEMSAIRFMLDCEHFALPRQPNDHNLYAFGDISGHNVVIACLPGSQGKSAAAQVATNLDRTFPNIESRLLIGIAGGVPSRSHDIRLGDVVVSMPEESYAGVVQYDLGKDTEDGFALKGYLSPSPPMLRSAVQRMRSNHQLEPNRISSFITEMMEKGRRLRDRYQRPSSDSDILFEDDSHHSITQQTCEKCDPRQIISRPKRDTDDSYIHYGLIASGDRVLRSSLKRNSLRSELGDILCFEMEAAGIATEISCLVIRGISDYADSHKNDKWQGYAAAAAAGCAKELLSCLPAPSTKAYKSSTSEELADSEVVNAPTTNSSLKVKLRI